MYKRIVIADYYQQKNNSQIFFDKQVTADHHCTVPWESMIVNRNGECYICHSPAWAPISIGSLLDYDNLFDLLNSDQAKSIRTEILDNRYTYCNQNICGSFFGKLDKSLFNQTQTKSELYINRTYPDEATVTRLPYRIVFDFDQTCNYQCPSCRSEVINHNTGYESEINNQVVEKIKKVILSEYSKIQYPRTFRWAGGEPFISRAYIDLWQYIIDLGNPNLKNVIQTNGSYLSKKKDLLIKLMPYISKLSVSIDAGSANTYKSIRVNGVWENLLTNCQLVTELIKDYSEIEYTSDFITQLGNYKEIPDYIKICKELQFKKIVISKMWNWGTWSDETFNQLNVSDSNHPLYNEFLEIIQPYKNDPQIDLSYWKNDIT